MSSKKIDPNGTKELNDYFNQPKGKVETEQPKEQPKEESKIIAQAKDDVTKLSLYGCDLVTDELERIANENDGELSEENIQLLVDACMQAENKIIGMCKYIKVMESKIKSCKERKAEINEIQKAAEAVITSMTNHMGKYVHKKGKKLEAGEFTLTTRTSKSTFIPKGFDHPFYCKQETVLKPDAKVIKAAIENGEEVTGCFVAENIKLKIK